MGACLQLIVKVKDFFKHKDVTAIKDQLANFAMEKRALLTSASQSYENSSESKECYCEDSSCGSSCSSSSYYSDSDSSVPEWETSIAPNGELLYIDCDPKVLRKSIQQETEGTNLTTKTSIRKSTRGKFLKLLHGRDSKRNKNVNKNQESHIHLQDTARVKFQDHDEGEIFEVFLKASRHENMPGHRGTFIESLLGLSVSTLSDGNRIMIAGFIPNSEAAKLSVIKIGDWLRSINNIDINFQNLNAILEEISPGSQVALQLQKVAGVEVTKNPPTNELCNMSQFVQQMLSRKVDESVNEHISKFQACVLYLNTSELNDTGFECENISYSYPPSFSSSLLYKTRGVFITLNHLLSNLSQSQPYSTSVLVDENLVHIAYEKCNTNILYLMLPGNRVSCYEAVIILKGIVRVLKFTTPAIGMCFEKPLFKDSLDKLFSNIFTKILHGDSNLNMSNKEDNLKQVELKFEDLLPAVNYLALHDEAQIQIEDSLSELEASDYREWNEEPLDCQRLFTILGSALFHLNYLIVSHLVHEDLIDVYLFCEHHNLFYLSQNEPVRSLVLWREVYPFSCNRDVDSERSLFVVPSGKRYLLIVGKGKELLAVLMEAGGCTEPAEDNLGPDAFYVEEAQATLEHLIDLGIPEISDHFILNPTWQVVVPEIPLKCKMDFLGTKPFAKSASASKSKDAATVLKKKPEVTSILKHQSPDHLQFSSSVSLYEDTSENQSEDSMSQSSYSETSEEPVVGRRIMREKKIEDSDEDYDIDDYHNSNNDLADLKQILLAETAEIKSAHLTAGNENVLYYYVHLDLGEGLLVCPPKIQITSTLENILQHFRICAQQIHKTFENTLRFKNMLAQDMPKLVVNKSLVAIKEQGMLFEFEDNNPDAAKKFGKLHYWVVGRLFYTPHPREVYICYQDSVPQNIIEIAFKLGVTSGKVLV